MVALCGTRSARFTLFAILAGLSFAGLAQPSPAPKAQASILRSGALSLTVHVSHGRFSGLRVHDAITNRTFNLPEAFVLTLNNNVELRSTNMQVQPANDALLASDPHQALRGATALARPAASSCWSFQSSDADAHVDWCLILRPDADYARELIRITTPHHDLPLTEVRMLQFDDAGAHVDGTVKGSPIVDENMFFGFEHPLSNSAVKDGKVTASLHRELPLRAGQSVVYSSVLGTSRPGQLRRAFLAYIESERPRPYRPFLHYNSWYDLGYGNRFDEAGALDRVHAFGEELKVKRDVQLDSYLFDDGWDDPNTLWGFNSGFPNGFAKVGDAAAKYGAGVGVWLSPWGGYSDQKTQRIAYGRAHGYEILNNGYALSGPKYFERFEQTCLDMVERYHVNQFKFDGTGNADRVFPGSAFDSDFDAAIHLIETLRKQEPSIFINLTTGTTASPFWLFYADSIWRDGEDHDFTGVGTWRQKWITYRDAQTYANIVRKGPLFPLNSLMLHGLIFAKQAEHLATDPNDDFADEVHSYFGTGTQLQEMYITPSLLSPKNWDILADAARWSRERSETLKDVHWLGGDPQQLQVYGWAAWSPHLGIVTLRNPSDAPKTFTLDLSTAFELGSPHPSAYKLHSVWNPKDLRTAPKDEIVRLGDRLPIHLAPFEVITLEATPTQSPSH